MIEFSEKGESLIFSVRVVPRSSKSEIVGKYNGALKVKIAAPPVDNAANTELIDVLSKFFGVSRNSIEILSGASGKTKTIRVIDADPKKYSKFEFSNFEVLYSPSRNHPFIDKSC